MQHAMQENTSLTQSSGILETTWAHFKYPLLPLAMQMWGEVGPDVQALTKELATRQVEHKMKIPSDKSQYVVVGTKIACLRWRFSFVSQ